MTRWRAADLPFWLLVAIPCILAVIAGTVYGLSRKAWHWRKRRQLRQWREERKIVEMWERWARIKALNYTQGIESRSPLPPQ